MASSDGLHRLTEYLTQTRRQANAAIDILNTRIEELESSNMQLREKEKNLRLERDDFQNQLKLLKAENSTKFQLRERDDWKAVLDSVQKDRQRLSDECETLKSQLDILRSKNERLQKETEVHSGKLILGMAQNNKDFKMNRIVENTTNMTLPTVNDIRHEHEMQVHEGDVKRVKEQCGASDVPLLNRSLVIDVERKKSTGGIISSLWCMIFGGDQNHVRKGRNPKILIV